MDGQCTVKNTDLSDLAANVTRLSRLLTRERDSLPAAYLNDPGLRRAYQAYFLLPNLQKIQVLLSELALHSNGPATSSRLRVLDLGCGPGTSLLGALEFFSRRKNPPKLELVGLDQVSGNLEIAREVVAASSGAHLLASPVATIRSSIENALPHLTGTFDLVIFSNVLNELFPRDAQRIGKCINLVQEFLARLLAPDGTCIVIEPALRETSREMLMLRDGLLDQGLTVFAPCLYRGPCPALVNPKDWCHEDIPWDPPASILELDRLTGLRKDSLKFSYLLLRKDRSTLSDISGEQCFRVVSEPLVSKGKVEYFICGQSGRKLVTRLDKDRTAENDAFTGLQRGDVARFVDLIDEEKRYKVGKETSVNLIRRIGI
jgi:SAM-dependent methyltransferase